MTEKAVTAEHSRPAPPAGLAARGRRFWRETVEKYDLNAAEMLILQETCRTLDDLDRLADAIAADGVTVLGSAGQTVVNAALTEARGQRLALHRLVSALNLPDAEGEAVPSPQRIRAKRAAASRWRDHQTDAELRAALRTTS